MAIGAGNDLFDPRLRSIKPLLARSSQSLPTLVQADRLIKWYIAAFQLLHDLFKPGQRLLKAHLRNILPCGSGCCALVHAVEH